jgi:bifunctional non-homologous end joining protein LigD
MLLPIQPINPARVAAPFDHPDFVFELKYDGFRSLCYVEDSRCELVSRKRNIYKSFAPLATALSRLQVTSAILEGEIVCLDSEGRSQFLELMRRRRADVIFYAFDLLWHGGEDLRGLPLVERKRRLQRLIRVSRIPSLLYADYVGSAFGAGFHSVAPTSSRHIPQIRPCVSR